MNFDDAISAHIKWKARLNRFIDDAGAERLDSATVCKDNLCDLGKWIYGEGAKYNTAKHYTDLVAKHANFHRCAAEIVKKVESNQRLVAKALLAGEFTAASKETVSAIMRMKKETT